MDAPLPLERYAELSAEIDARKNRDQVLAAAGITVQAWLMVQEWWMGQMAREATARVFETSRRFQQTYVLARRKLAERGTGRVPTKAPASRPDSWDMAPPSSAGPMSQALPMSQSYAPASQVAPASIGYAGAGGIQPSGPRLTLPQYASMCVELAMYPTNHDQIRQRYGFDEAGHQRENSEWQWRFDQDKTLFERYLAMFRQYRDWIQGGAGSAPNTTRGT